VRHRLKIIKRISIGNVRFLNTGDSNTASGVHQLLILRG